jgi:DNA-binding SARP family transcriptional activator
VFATVSPNGTQSGSRLLSGERPIPPGQSVRRQDTDTRPNSSWFRPSPGRHASSFRDATGDRRPAAHTPLLETDTPDGYLCITLFGGISLFREGCRLPDFETARARDLFSFLVLNRNRLHSRDSLMGILWGDRPDAIARKNLRTDIWRVRRVLEPPGVERGTFLVTQQDSVGFNGGADYWLDVEEFERTVASHHGCRPDDLMESNAANLRGAVGLYRGDLLEEVYDEWCLIERERLRARFLATLELLMRFHAGRRDWPSALSYGRRILQRDPLREHIYRDVMRFHYFQGDRPAAIAQFRTCASLLEKEMDVEPMQETVALMKAIETEILDSATADISCSARRYPSGETVGLIPVVAEIKSALRQLQDASARLISALSRVEEQRQDES